MKHVKHLLLATAVAVAWLIPSSVTADEQFTEFLQELRARGWHETALDYLELVEARPDLPAEIRQVITYEKARTLLDSASQMRDLEKRQDRLVEAENNLKAFLGANPSHPLAAEANLQTGKLLLERGRVTVLQAEQPINQGKRRQLQQQARTQFDQAHPLLQNSRDQFEATYKSFPANIAANDPAFQQRQEALGKFLDATFQAVIVTYEKAQAFDRNDPKRKELLQQAADEFEGVFTDHRTLPAGLYARLYQGKCYEEMDDVRKARGIYDELLGHDPNRQTGAKRRIIADLQNQARHFRLICLNHPSTKDYQLVIDEAEQWLRENRPLRMHENGLGIQWELGRALESLANQQNTANGMQEQFFRRAVAAVEPVARIAGIHREAARAMLGRLRGRAGQLGAEPKDFTDASDLAQSALSRAEQNKAQEDWEAAAVILRKALTLADEKTAVEDINRVRQQLAFVYYQLQRSYEAAVLAGYVATRYPDSGIALNSAYIAMASYLQAYNQAGRNVDFEIDQMIQSAQYLAEKWPQSGEADKARIILGAFYTQRGDPAKAAEWFTRVPEGSEHFLEARQKAGMAYWGAFLKAKAAPADQRPNDEVIENYRMQAQTILEESVASERKRLGQQQPPVMLLTSELQLVQMALFHSDYQTAFRLLQRGDGTGLFDVVKAEPRSDLTPAVVAEIYKVALRCFVGMDQLDAAQDILNRLEQLGSDAGSLALVYRELGEELQKQIEQLRIAGNRQQLDQVVNTFESFLTRLWEQHQQSPVSYYVLSWVAEAYYGLGDGLAPMYDSSPAQQEEAAPRFRQAEQVLREIIRLSGSDPQYLPEAAQEAWDPRDALRLRLATYQRRVGDAQSCEQAYEEILSPLLRRLVAEPAKALQPQIEAAHVLQTWAQYDPDQWKRAVSGQKFRSRTSGKIIDVVWGWEGIAKRLQASPSARKGKIHYATFYEVIYNLASCRRNWALSQRDPAVRNKLLAMAEHRVRLTHQLAPDLGGPEWFARFDRLLRQLQADQNKQPTGLTRLRSTGSQRAVAGAAR